MVGVVVAVVVECSPPPLLQIQVKEAMLRIMLAPVCVEVVVEVGLEVSMVGAMALIPETIQPLVAVVEAVTGVIQEEVLVQPRAEKVVLLF